MEYTVHCNITSIQQLCNDINKEICTLRSIAMDDRDAYTTSYTRDIANAVGANSIKVYYSTTRDSSNYILHVDVPCAVDNINIRKLLDSICTKFINVI